MSFDDFLSDLMSELIKHKNCPKVLFQYTDSNGVLGILSNKNIWATDAQYLNDSSEYEHGGSIIKSELIGIIDKNEGPFKDFVVKVFDSMKSGALFNFVTHVASFSPNKDSLSQWRAYANDGDGYSVGFPKEILCELEGGEVVNSCVLTTLLPVFYKDQELIQLVGPILFEAYKDPDINEAVSSARIAFGLLSALSKQPGFEEESEWRLVAFRSSNNVKDLKVRVKASVLVPYVELPLKLTDRIIEICRGPKQQIYSENSLKYLAQMNNLQIEISKSKVSYR